MIDQRQEHYWSRLALLIRKEYGIHGHADPGGEQWYYIARNGLRHELCRTAGMAGSAKDDFITICEAVIEKDLDTFGIAGQPGMRG